jgi:ABC-2 type transport system permease protein
VRRVTADASRPAVAGGLVAPRAERPAASPAAACSALAWRALLKLARLPEQLGDIIGIPILFTLMFTYLFGGALAGSTHAYLQYLLPGTMAMAVSLVTVYSGVTLNTDMASGAHDRFRTLPIWRPAPVVGGLIGDVARYLVAAALVVVLGLVMGFDARGGVAGVLLAIALTIVFALSLSWIWTAAALLLRTPAAVQTLGLLVLFPLTFASNVFVDPHTMPGWAQTLVELNPLSHLTSAARGLMHGTPAAHDVLWVVAASALITAVFAPLTSRLYRRA